LTAAPATVRARRAVDDVGADAPSDARHARLEVRHDDVDGVVITLHGDLGCRDVALLSCHLHTELDASPARMVVDLSRLRGGGDAVRQVLGTAAERAEADGIALRLLESAHHLGRHR
jgi:anti-anti-sigma regulatory factor